SFGEGFVMNDTIYLMYGEILESYDSDFSLLNIYDYGRRIENTDIVKIGSNNWTIGYSVDFENPHESSTILKSVILIRNASKQEITDGHRELKWNKFEMKIGNSNNLFLPVRSIAAMKIVNNNSIIGHGPLFESSD